jgi:hypothetical protein
VASVRAKVANLRQFSYTVDRSSIYRAIIHVFRSALRGEEFIPTSTSFIETGSLEAPDIQVDDI